jgi:hypothetical protein
MSQAFMIIFFIDWQESVIIYSSKVRLKVEIKYGLSNS